MKRRGSVRRAFAALALAAIVTACRDTGGAAITLAGERSPTFSALTDLKREFESRANVRVDMAERDRAALLASFSSDAAPDLAVVPHYLLGQLVAARAIRPIQRLIDNLGMYDPRVVDHQKDLLPWWKELSQYRRRTYGYPAALRTTIGPFHEWLAYAYASGARILDSPSGDAYGEVVVNSAAAIRATERYVAMHDQQTRAPLDGAIAIDGLTFVIPARASHPREAFLVMQQILSNDVQMQMASRGVLSPRASVHEASVRQMAEAGAPTPTIPEAQAIIDVMTPALADIVAGKVTPKAGLDAVAVRLRTMLPEP